MKANRILAMCLSACMLISSASCAKDPTPPDTYVEARVPLSFTPATDASSARTSAQSCVLNYLYYLTKGNYEMALEYVNISDGVLFDSQALQRAVLADKLGRGDDILFYVCEPAGEDAYLIEYDLTLNSNTATSTTNIKVSMENGQYGIDLIKSNYVQMGRLIFKAPKYAPISINGVPVPQSMMGNDYVYDITQGVPKLDKEGTINLTVHTNFGVDFDYPVFFTGNKEAKAKTSINDEHYASRYEMTFFQPEIPRELREKAEAYIKTIIPVLMDDILHGRSWESADIRKYMGDDSEIDAMFSSYYKYSTAFRNAGAEDNDKLYVYDASCFDYDCSDAMADKKGFKNSIVDYNVLQLYVSYNYNYLYTRGAANTEKNATGKNGALVSLSLDENGEFYIYDLDDGAFKFSVG